ncbi:MAG: hypothetical protein ABFC77_06175 [Thermoguttaceae bacterium]
MTYANFGVELSSEGISMTAIRDLKPGDTIITDSDGTARTIRRIGPGPGTLTRIAFDDGTVALAPAGTEYTLTDFATRAKPRTHTVAIELRGSPLRRAYVYVTPGTMLYRNWFTAGFQPAADFDTAADAQEWLVRVVGYEALDHEIHHARP